MNAGTPFEIASTPVTAEQPEANALSSSSTPTVAVTGKRSGEPITATGCERKGPTTITAKTLRMNTSVGSNRKRADSAMPNMLSAVSSSRPIRQTASRWCDSAGKTLPRLAAPAARLTATVST